MRRIFILLLLVVAVACNDESVWSGGGAENPLSDCVLPPSAQIGDDVLIQWNGFPENPVIILVSENGDVYEVEVSVVTASGILFRIPPTLEPGVYMVLLGDKELGSFEVMAPDMPIIGLKLPSDAVQGEEIVIEGIGFEDGCGILLIDADGNEYILAAGLEYSGISIILPEDMCEGDYQLYLVQDGIRWLLSSNFSVYKEFVLKELNRIDFYSPYVGSAMLMLSWEIEREFPMTFTISQSIVDGEDVSLDVYDMYVFDDEGYCELVEDGFESSNDMGVSYTLDSDGTVTLADVLIYGDDVPTQFSWTYDQDGFLTDISSPARSFRSFEYEDGNMVRFRDIAFEYADSDLVNNPHAADVIWGYISVMEKNDPFVCFPYLAGWYVKSSSQLPTSIILPSPTGTGTVTYPIEYEFDDDGYVIDMSWDKNHIVFGF